VDQFGKWDSVDGFAEIIHFQLVPMIVFPTNGTRKQYLRRMTNQQIVISRVWCFKKRQIQQAEENSQNKSPMKEGAGSAKP